MTGWADVVECHAASPRSARRLVGQLRACEAAAIAFCRLLERWGRGEAVPATAGSRRRRSGTPPTGSRRRLRVSRRRCPPTCSSSSRSGRRGAAGTAGPAPASSSSGARCSNAPASVRARTASPPCISSSRCSSGRSRGSTTRLASTLARSFVALGGPLRPARHALRRHRRRPPRARGVALSSPPSADGLTRNGVRHRFLSR